MNEIDALTPEEESASTAAFHALEQGTLTFAHAGDLFAELEGLWIRISFPAVTSPTGVEGPAFRVQVTGASPPHEWAVAISDDFRKAVKSIDRKLQGRLLEAIMHILTEPLTPRGDIIKPLNADMKGHWRYRIGDFRLVYHPDPRNRRILLVAFSGRGDAYA